MGNDSYLPYIKVILIIFLLLIFIAVAVTLFKELKTWIKSRK